MTQSDVSHWFGIQKRLAAKATHLIGKIWRHHPPSSHLSKVDTNEIKLVKRFHKFPISLGERERFSELQKKHLPEVNHPVRF
jgi:hypothetical protein